MRVNCWFNDDFLKELDKCADEQNLSRSEFITVCCMFCMVMPFGISKISTKKSLIKSLFNGEFSPDEKNEVLEKFVNDKD